MTTDPDNDLVRRWMQPELPKRFYREAAAASGPDGWRVLLDGRPARTPKKVVLAVPGQPLARQLAAEWAGQGEVIDPSTMPLTRLVSVAIDGVVPDPAPVRAEIVKYAGSDLLCYRAGEPEGLVRQQAELWDPLLAFMQEEYGARFVLSEGVMFVTQPAAAVEAVRARVEAEDGLGLAALQAMTTLTGSALLSIAVADGRLTAAEAWDAAHVDETWNEALWGADAEAGEKRRRRFGEMEAAAAVYAAARNVPA